MKGSTVISIQVSPKPELLAELGAECPDDRDVHGEVDEHDREPGGSAEIPERARPPYR